MITPTKRVQKLVYYVTNKGLLVASGAFNYGTVRSNLHMNCLINDKPLTLTHTAHWYFIEGEKEILSYKEKVSDKNVLVRYQLKDADMEVEGKIPFKLSPEDVEQYWDEDDEEYVWKHFNSLQSLYEPVHEHVIGGYEFVEFEVQCLGEVQGDIDKPIETVFNVFQEGSWGAQKAVAVQIDKIAHYYELDKILTPEFAIHKKPCYLTSKQTYDIIRTFVKDNIDPKQAIITSDYDFCFTVKKKVAVKPWVSSTELKKANGRSYRSPKFKSQTVDHKQVEIFEMTHEQKGYQGYTIIKGFTGQNLEDLVCAIKYYLHDLIGYINKPVAECECCKGTGHIVDKTFKMNAREE